MTRVRDDVVRILHRLGQYPEILFVLLGEGVAEYYPIRGVLGDNAVLRIGELNVGNVNGEKNGGWISLLGLQSFNAFPQNLQRE